MDPRHLRTFVAVAERLHFRLAAERLFLSQPTVSAHIQALERELGGQLLDRRGRHVALTAAGERLLPYARRILALEAAAEEELRSWRMAYDERLRISSSIFVGAMILPRALRLLLEELPRTDVSLRTAFSQEVVPEVRQGGADLGLSRLEPAREGLGVQRLGREPVVAVAPAAWGEVDLPAALASHPLLAHNHPGYWDRLLANLQALGLACRPMEVRQVDVTLRLMAEGLGLSFLPRSAVAAQLETGVLRTLAVPGELHLPHAETWALWPEERPPRRAAARLLELLAQPEAAPPAGTGAQPARPPEAAPPSI